MQTQTASNMTSATMPPEVPAAIATVDDDSSSDWLSSSVVGVSPFMGSVEELSAVDVTVI